MAEKLERNNREALVSIFLRWGLAVAFLYASISAFLTPENWIAFIPQFIKAIIPARTFLHIHSIGEMILALWLLSNKKIFYAATLSALALLAIIVFNTTQLDIVFRDTAILFMAIALGILYYKKER